MGPGSFGTGKTTAPDGSFSTRMISLQWGPVHLEPGSGGSNAAYGDGGNVMLQWGPVHLEPGRLLTLEDGGVGEPASMGPGSFGTGKSHRRERSPPAAESSFNGARFIWNREERQTSERLRSFRRGWLQWGPVHLEPGSELAAGLQSVELVGLQWGPVHLEPGSRRRPVCLRRHERPQLQWGPVHLEPGRYQRKEAKLDQLESASMGPGSFGTGKSPSHRPLHQPVRLCFNGARFIWNREASGPIDRPRAHETASMGPGSFGTGKEHRRHRQARRRKAPVTASMGPGSFGTGKASPRPDPAHACAPGFNGARFIWNREVGAEGDRPEEAGGQASMGPGSFGTGKPSPGGRDLGRPDRLQWGPVHLEPGSDHHRGSGVRLGRVASMGPGSFGTGKPGRSGAPPMATPGTCFNGARFIWNREG